MNSGPKLFTIQALTPVPLRVFARFLGRQGGVSGLNAQELEILAAFHARHDRVTENLVRQAFAQAVSPTISEILFQLQILLHERND